jgi:hypothetical protein
MREKHELFPALDKSQPAGQLPSVKKKFLLHGDHAKATMKDLLNTISAKDMVEKTCETTASVWIENKGNGNFVSHVLPLRAVQSHGILLKGNGNGDFATIMSNQNVIK